MNENTAMPNHLVETLIQENPFPRNQVALMSGLTNTYLRDMEQGKAINVKRDRLLRLGVALGLDLEDIDKLLNVYDRTPLHKEDIPVFLAISRKMAINHAHYPIRSLVAFELWANSCRYEPGPQVSCLQVVAASLRVPGHTTLLLKGGNHHPLLPALMEAIETEKKESLIELLKRHNVDHFACRHCLSDYLQLCKNPEELSFRKRHIESLMELISSQKRFHFYLGEVCPFFQFNIKQSATNDPAARDKLWYQGKIIRSCPGHQGGRLIGFATDNPHVVQTFKNELEYIRSQVIEKLCSKSNMLEYLQSIIE